MKKLTTLLVLGFIVIIAVLTNPTKEDFGDFMRNHIDKQADSDFEEVILALTGNLLDYVGEQSERRNYVIFSTFELGDAMFIGAFGNFMQISEGEDDSISIE